MMTTERLAESLPSLEDAREYIYSIDFTRIINKMHTQGWPKYAVKAISEEYRHYLFINKKYFDTGMKLPPSEEVDEFWHNHILDTQKYREDCQHIFGFYFDHYPYFSLDGKTTYDDLKKAFSELEKIYFQEFGKEMPKIMNRFSLIIMAIKRLFAFW